MTPGGKAETLSAVGLRRRIVYRAAPTAVFDAAARPGGANGWWSTDGDVAEAAGQLLRLSWSAEDYIVFRVDSLERPAAMDWVCVAQHDRNLPLPDEWVGTTLRFSFSAAPDGTMLEFEHAGLIPSLQCHDVCASGWDFFLRHSLGALIETGKGSPYRASFSNPQGVFPGPFG